MANLTDALDPIIKEELAQGIRETRTGLDPVWQDIIVSSFGVTTEGIGRDWKKIWPYTRGVAGALEFSAASVLTGPNLALDDTAHIGVLGAPNGFPRRLESPVPSFYDVAVGLKEQRGNLFMPMKWLHLDSLNASVGSAGKQLLKQAAFHAAQRYACAMYTASATTFQIIYNLRTSGANVSWGTGVDNVTLIIDNSSTTSPNGRINMLFEGMLVDHYSSGGTKKNTTNVYVITRVDYINNTFVLKSYNASLAAANFEDASADGDYLTFRTSASGGQAGNQTAGFNSWMKGSGTLSPYTINGSALSLTDNPEWSSLIVANLNGPLTERALTRYVGRFMERLGTLCELDTIITPAGVVHSYLENEDNLMHYERNGRRLEVKGGWAGIDYEYNSKPFRWAISTFIEPKACYVIKLKNNIMELVPPTLNGTGTEANFDNEFRFVGPLGGLKGAFMHERLSDGSVGDTLEAPYFRICELYAEQPQGIIIRGCDETI